MKLLDLLKNLKFISRLRDKLTIRASFTWPFFLQGAAMTILFGFIIYKGSMQMAEAMIEQINKRALESIEKKIILELETPMNINRSNENVIQSGLMDIKDSEKRNMYFANLIKENPKLAMSYIGLLSGEFYGARRTENNGVQVAVNNEKTNWNAYYYAVDQLGKTAHIEGVYTQFDPRKRPWYQAAIKAGEPTYTDIYEHFVFKEPTITAAQPILIDGSLIGVLGSDYLLSRFEKNLSEFSTGTSGLVYIYDENQKMIGSSTPIKCTAANHTNNICVDMLDVDNPLILKSYESFIGEQGQSVQKIKYNSGTYITSYKDIIRNGLNWRVVVITAESDFLTPVEIAIRNIVLLSVLSIVLYFGLAYALAKRISKPIVELNDAAKALADRRGYAVKDYGRKDEIGQLIRSFNHMRSDLNQLVVNLEEEVDTRTKELQVKNNLLEQLSYLDGLTGVANRRKFDAFLQESWKSSTRSNRALVLLMIDIDKFKLYNDHFGHLEGDKCLRKIAQTLSTHIRRENDLFARYGGEEFAVILNHTNLEFGKMLAKRMIESIMALEMEHPASEWRFVTISIGVAGLTPTHYKDKSTLIEMADKALYEAKAKGRNTFVVTLVE